MNIGVSHASQSVLEYNSSAWCLFHTIEWRVRLKEVSAKAATKIVGLQERSPPRS